METMRSCVAAAWITSSESRVHGVCASSSTPAPSARSTCPFPCACAVTGRSAACAASQIAASSASDGRGSGVGVQRHLDRRRAEPRELFDGRRRILDRCELPPGPRRRPRVPGRVSAGRRSASGRPLGSSGPSKDGISEASASEKIRSAGHARSRTAVTPPRSTAAGSESSMWTWRSATAGITKPSTRNSRSAARCPSRPPRR